MTMKPRYQVNPFMDFTDERKRKFDLLPKHPGALEHQLAILSLILGGQPASGIEAAAAGETVGLDRRQEPGPQGDAHPLPGSRP